MNTTSKSKALYPYTLQPVALDLTESEFRTAQMALFNKTSQNHHLKQLRLKEWIILGIISAVAAIGLLTIKGYSTILFWTMLVGVVIYLLLRTLGLQWYMKKEYEKQVANSDIPKEMATMKLGIQAHGLIMSMPSATMPQQTRGMQIKFAPTQQAVVPWEAVSSWEETDEFLFVMFTIKGQKGSQIIPKRLQHHGLPIKTIKEHLSTITPKGLTLEKMTTTS